ncbi:MAG: hypothetical protein ACUVYA_13475 [Planctomycetota bacterium]
MPRETASAKKSPASEDISGSRPPAEAAASGSVGVRIPGVSELVESEFARYQEMRRAVRDRFEKCRRSSIVRNPN